jgi:hypothetical protein
LRCWVLVGRATSRSKAFISPALFLLVMFPVAAIKKRGRLRSSGAFQTYVKYVGG